MGLSGHGILIEIVGDERSYLRTVDRTVGANTKLDASFKQVGVNATLSADAQIKAAVRAQEALRANALVLSQRAASLPHGSNEQVAASLLATEAQAKYARAIGVTTAGTTKLSGATKTAEHDLSKTVRGALAGSSAFHGLGRSLAFASGGFLAIEAGTAFVDKSIISAEGLDKAQRSLDTAIEHTHGNLAKLRPEYIATAKAAEQYGQGESDAIEALARATVLTGNAASAQRAYEEALLISKATGKDFNQVLVATSKAQEGETTSLRRYGILVATNSTGLEQYVQVQKRFGGQAAANTTESDRLDASVANFETTLGTDVLPTFDQLAQRFTRWLDHLEKSGKLQKDVNRIVTDGGHVFHTLEGAVELVDKVTGSFANTLKIVIGLKVASTVAGWIGNLGRLEAAWGGVKVAAAEAATAEGLAAGGGRAAGASGVAARVGMYTGAGVDAAAGGAAARGSVGSSRAAKAVKGFIAIAVGELAVQEGQRLATSLGVGASGPPGVNWDNIKQASKDVAAGVLTAEDRYVLHAMKAHGLLLEAAINRQINENIGNASSSNLLGVSGLLHPSGLFPPATTATSPVGPVPVPVPQIKNFQLSQAEQLAQAQAALTRSTVDDIAGARQVIARIKRLIADGRLHGQALVQALGLEASALSTVWAAEDAAAQKRAAAAQAAQDRIQAQIQDSIDPLRLEVALSRAQALGKPLAAILRRLRASAEAALASGKLSLEQQKEAWDQITSLNQQLSSTAAKTAHEFHLANTRELTQGLGLSDAERAVLRARLSQLGPGRHRPDQGVGAYGYEIGANGRPIHVHTTLEVDGQKMATVTTKHQQKHRKRNSSQRRGPNT